MKIALSWLLILFATNAIFSQDTIRFLDNAIKVAKVTEINIYDIKYKRFDNPDGPLYVSGKEEIKSIKFSNGLIETFNTSYTQVSTIHSSTNFSGTTNNHEPFEKIIIIDKTKLMHFGKPMGESRLLRLINNYTESEKKTRMIKEYSAMKSFKKKQYVFGFIGLGAGVGLAYVGSMLSIVSGEPLPVAIGLIGGITIGATGAIFAYSNKQKRLQKKIEIATIYNN